MIQLRGAIYYLEKLLNKNQIKDIYAYVYPYIKYGIELYGSCCKNMMNRLQRQQNMILKMLYKKDRLYRTNDLYKELELLKCHDMHKFFIGIFVYKQQNHMLPSIFDNYYKQKSMACSSRDTRQSNPLYEPFCRTNGGQCSLKYTGAKLWNQIAVDVKSCTNLYSFKSMLRLFLLKNYT